MARIKSALELALENTADISGDKEAIRKKELGEKGRRIASRFLFDPEDKTEEFRSNLQSVRKEERDEVLAAARRVFFDNISLPRNDMDEELFGKITRGLAILSGDEAQVQSVMEQLSQFLRQYGDNRNQIIEHLKQQFEPQLKAKARELSQQYGREVKIQPEQDPEFMKHLNHNMNRLDQQYQEALKRAKEELSEMIGFQG